MVRGFLVRRSLSGFGRPGCNGVRFFPESRAERFLTRRNYFFKVKAFAKGFDRWRGPDGAPGAYMNLDFACSP